MDRAQGALSFDVTAIVHRTDLPVQDLATPPSTGVFAAGPPPPSAGEALLGRADLAAFRSGPIEPPAASPAPATGNAQAPPPESGLLLDQLGRDAPRVVWLDGVAVAWISPRASLPLPSLPRGRFSVQWRSFLGDAWDPPQVVVTPGRAEVGAP